MRSKPKEEDLAADPPEGWKDEKETFLQKFGVLPWEKSISSVILRWSRGLKKSSY